MTRGGRPPTDDTDLEVIELEPSQEAQPRRDIATPTGVSRRRGPIVIATLVIAALVGSAVVNRSQHANRSTSTTRPPSNRSAGMFPFRIGAQILTGGLNGLLLLDTDTGRVTVPRITNLPEGPTTIVAHSGGTVAVRVNAGLYWFTLESRAAHFVDGTTAFPATQTGYVWYAGSRSATLVPGAANAVATRGPAIGATRAGLVVTTKAGVLLQPIGHSSTADARLLLRAPATVIGVHPDRIAWVARECGVLRCLVHVTEIATAATSSWLQLTGHPSRLALEASSAIFAPDGNHVAIVVSNNYLTTTQTLVVADLRTRETTVANTYGRFNQPARPGSEDATGITVDWTLDSRFLLLAPASGTGPVGVMEPGAARIVPSRAPMGVITTAAAIGVSTLGPLDLLRRAAPGRVDTGGPTKFASLGLHLIGADDEQVDILDLATGRLRSWPVGGVVENRAVANLVARVTGGWLAVRGRVVDLLADDGPTDSAKLVDAGSLVFSSNHGRNAWIAREATGLLWRVEPFDPATGKLGPATTGGMPVGAVDAGLIVTGTTAFGNSTFDLVDPHGRLQPGPVIDSSRINVLAAAGRHVAFVGSGGLYLLDLVNRTNQLITERALQNVALSADGTAVAWIEDDPDAPGSGRVMAMRVGEPAVRLGNAGGLVLVADDGTVLFTSGASVHRGRVDENGSTPVSGLAPYSGAVLALG